MSKIPLKTRKSIKTALEAAAGPVKKASEAFGKELTFVDNTSELFEQLQASGKGEDWLFNLGGVLVPYADQFAKAITAFCANADNKEQLEAELTTGKFGVRLAAADKEDVYWCLEEGTLWMETKAGWFGSYMDYYDADRLAKKLGKGDSMPLNTRKSLKQAQPVIDKHVQQASKAFGKELTWVDNYQELFDKLKANGKGDDYLWSLGEPLEKYAEQIAKGLTEFCKNNDNKEQLEAELTTGKVGVRLVDGDDEYWRLENGTLWMETKPGWFGSYLDYYDAPRLTTKLGKSDSMPLNTRKSLKEAQGKIAKSVQEASKAFGKELTWVDNYQELFDKLKANGKGDDYLWKLGEPLEKYAEQLAKAFANFCKDADNKEALEEVITSGKVGVRLVDASKQDEYWGIEDGTLWMESKEGWFGSYLDYYDSERLEKKL